MAANRAGGSGGTVTVALYNTKLSKHSNRETILVQAAVTLPPPSAPLRSALELGAADKGCQIEKHVIACACWILPKGVSSPILTAWIQLHARRTLAALRNAKPYICFKKMPVQSHLGSEFINCCKNAAAAATAIVCMCMMARATAASQR